MVEQVVERTLDEGERRADFVGDVGEERNLRVVEFALLLLLQPFLRTLHAHAVFALEKSPCQQQESDGQQVVENLGQCGEVEGRVDHDEQGAFVHTLHTVAVDALQVERVGSVGQVGITDARLARVEPSPVGVVTLEAVADLVEFGRNVTQHAGRDGEGVLPVVEVEPLAEVDAGVERRAVGPWLLQLVKEIEGGEGNARLRVRGAQVLGMETHESVDGAEVEVAALDINY